MATKLVLKSLVTKVDPAGPFFGLFPGTCLGRRHRFYSLLSSHPKVSPFGMAKMDEMEA